jgi:competence protein ComEC
MNLLKFIPIKLTFLLVLGILIGYFFDVGIKFPLLLILVFLSVLGLILLKEKKANGISFGIIAAFTTILLGVLIVAIAQPKNADDHYSNILPNQQESWKLKVTEVLKSNSFSERYFAEVAEYNSYKASGKIILNKAIDSTFKKLQVDDELIVFAPKNEIKSPLNPYQFNYRNYLEIQGIYHQLKLNADNHMVLEYSSRTIKGYAASLRQNIITKIEKANFSNTELGIIQALFLGQRDTISEETYTDYKNAGAVHILAVSGLHIGILLLFLEFMLRPMELLPNGKTFKLVVVVFLLWGFAFLAGLSTSVGSAVK